MTDYDKGIVLEARKSGLSQVVTKDGDFHKVSFNIHPNDLSTALSNMPLHTRVYLVVTEIADEGAGDKTEQPRPKGGERAKRAGILCNDPAFFSYLCAEFCSDGLPGKTMEDDCATMVRQICGVESRSQLDHNERAAMIWDQIVSNFYTSQRGQTTAAQQTQLESGPA